MAEEGTAGARDGFERYFAEKIWEMIPAVYRHEDGLGSPPGVLRALVSILAEQAAVLRRSHDRLWEDQFIELCDDWAVPYIGDLLGTRMVSALIPRAQRVDVAKTLYYRRRAGTPAVLEELIGDIAGWEGTVVEGFRRLGRCRHRLDPLPGSLAGRYTGTPPGGWADLRQPWVAQLAGTAFDEFHHTPDLRRPRGGEGRYAIDRLAFHLYRLPVFRVSGVTPCSMHGSLGFTFDPSGRDIPLFLPRNRPQDPVSEHGDSVDWTRWRPAREWELPGPLRCRVLRIILTAEDVVLKNRVLGIEEASGEVLAAQQMIAGRLDGWTAQSPGKRLVVDPERGRFLFLGDPPNGKVTVSYHHGFSTEIGAGHYGRHPTGEDRRPPTNIDPGGGEITAGEIANNGIAQIVDSATYGPVANKNKVADLVVRAADGQRPYVRLEEPWRLRAANDSAKLFLAGLWIGGANDRAALVLAGNYESIILEHMTVDPGGKSSEDQHAKSLPPVPLVIKGRIQRLSIRSSITGPIYTDGDGRVDSLWVSDSIVQSDKGLDVSGDNVHLERVTILGQLQVHRLWAVETLVTRLATVTDTQSGCFRFSAAPTGSRLPQPYESHWIGDSQVLFVSTRFGHPGYAQLSEAAPADIKQGAENGSEIGAFSRLLTPVKLDSLRAKVEEFVPVGLLPIFIHET